MTDHPFFPNLAAATAAFWPPGPEPMTTRSYSITEVMNWVSPRSAAGSWLSAPPCGAVHQSFLGRR
jgi:hypothetical protein